MLQLLSPPSQTTIPAGWPPSARCGRFRRAATAAANQVSVADLTALAQR